MKRLGANLRHLRQLKKLNQLELAEKLGIGRTTISNYERAGTEPNVEQLVILSKFFDITIDDLITKDLIAESHDSAPYVRSTPNPVHLNDNPVHLTRYARKSRNLLVPVSARAGYTNEWTQEEISQELVFVDIPGVAGEARTFEIAGNSMEPILFEGDFVVGIPITFVNQVEKDSIYVAIHSRSGVSVKFLNLKESVLHLIPANENYQAEEWDANDVKEIWKVIIKITRNLTHPKNLVEYPIDPERIIKIERFLSAQFPTFKSNQSNLDQ